MACSCSHGVLTESCLGLLFPIRPHGGALQTAMSTNHRWICVEGLVGRLASLPELESPNSLHFACSLASHLHFQGRSGNSVDGDVTLPCTSYYFTCRCVPGHQWSPLTHGGWVTETMHGIEPQKCYLFPLCLVASPPAAKVGLSPHISQLRVLFASLPLYYMREEFLKHKSCDNAAVGLLSQIAVT